MTCGTEPDALLMQRLNRYPPLRARVERLLGVVEDAAGDSLQADAAERRVIEELRQLGQEALTAWAERNLDKSAAEATAKPGIRGGGKKTLLAHDLRNHHGDGTGVAGWNDQRKAL